MGTEGSGKRHFFDSPGNVRLVLRALYVACAALVALDFVIPRHGHFTWENAPLFHAAFGLVGFAALVLVAKHLLRPLLKRDEDYYDR